MQVEPFLNFCESIIDLELVVLGDLEYQKKQWFIGDPRQGTYYFLIEEFLSDYQNLIKTEEYALFKDEKALRSLKKLYMQVETFTRSKPQVDSTIFTDENWIEIVEKAQETTQLLTKFIKRHRQ